jgi:hypothetical protein
MSKNSQKLTLAAYLSIATLMVAQPAGADPAISVDLDATVCRSPTINVDWAVADPEQDNVQVEIREAKSEEAGAAAGVSVLPDQTHVAVTLWLPQVEKGRHQFRVRASLRHGQDALLEHTKHFSVRCVF